VNYASSARCTIAALAVVLAGCNNSSGAGAPAAPLPSGSPAAGAPAAAPTSVPPAAPTLAPAAPTEAPAPTTAPAATVAAAPTTVPTSAPVATSAAAPTAAATSGAVGGAASACEPDKVATKYPGLAGKTLVIGMDPTNPPIEYRDANDPNKIVGFDPDFLDATMKCIGVKYEIHPGVFGGLIGELQAGRIDVEWSDLYYNPERGKVVDYVTYLTAGTGALVKKGNPAGIKSMDDICGHKAAANLGTVEEAALRDQSTKCQAAGKGPIEVTTYPDTPSTARAVQNGRSDASLFDLVAVDTFVKDNPDTERGFSIISGIKVGVGVKKGGNPELLKALGDAIKTLQADGTEKQLLQKNGMDPALELPSETVTSSS